MNISIAEIYKNRTNIITGVVNSIIKQPNVESLADKRLKICRTNECGFHDALGQSDKAVVKGSESCAECGCKLSWKTRAPGDKCRKGYW